MVKQINFFWTMRIIADVHSSFNTSALKLHIKTDLLCRSTVWHTLNDPGRSELHGLQYKGTKVTWAALRKSAEDWLGISFSFLLKSAWVTLNMLQLFHNGRAVRWSIMSCHTGITNTTRTREDIVVIQWSRYLNLVIFLMFNWGSFFLHDL